VAWATAHGPGKNFWKAPPYYVRKHLYSALCSWANKQLRCLKMTQWLAIPRATSNFDRHKQPFSLICWGLDLDRHFERHLRRVSFPRLISLIPWGKIDARAWNLPIFTSSVDGSLDPGVIMLSTSVCFSGNTQCLHVQIPSKCAFDFCSEIIYASISKRKSGSGEIWLVCLTYSCCSYHPPSQFQVLVVGISPLAGVLMGISTK